MLKDKVAIVTGGSSGIGRAIALAFAREGAKVVVSDLDDDGGRGTVQEVAQEGGEAIFVRADVALPSDMDQLVQQAVGRYGALHVACNNAGVGGDTVPTADYPIDEWNRVLSINLSGVFYGMKYQIRPCSMRGAARSSTSPPSSVPWPFRRRQPTPRQSTACSG
jgi:NAD(P)-dependent dehydrogenase (short-subunit alcohol dehydrogenase family)